MFSDIVTFSLKEVLSGDRAITNMMKLKIISKFCSTNMPAIVLDVIIKLKAPIKFLYKYQVR